MLDRKVLYIDGRDKARVRQDGPSLVVRCGAGASRRFPFRRLSRILVSGSVDWSTQALLACADAAIPVCFLSREGAVRARVLHPAPRYRLSKLRIQIERYFGEVPSAESGYQAWLDRELENARSAFVDAAGLACDLRGWDCLSTALFRRQTDYARAAHVRAFDTHLVGLLQAHVEHLLDADGVTADLPVLRRRFINLSQDYAQILVWRLRLHALRSLKRAYLRARRRGSRRAEAGRCLAAQVYESASQDVERQFAALVRRHRQQIRSSPPNGSRDVQ